ncbi:MAG: c-type cytochrome [Gemmatimonadetes bacterium]|nr:c-type cytochrome [Gemmatimonadota bacterium]
MRPALLLTSSALVLMLAGCGGGPEEGAESLPETADPSGTALPGEAPEPDPARNVEPASGEAVYTANCATCHGDGGTGSGPAAVGLEPPPSDMTDGQWTTGDGSLGAIRNTIVNGSPGTAMIAWQGTLTESEIQAVSEYVHSMSQGSAQ